MEGKYGRDYYMCNSFEDMEEMGWNIFNDNFAYYTWSDEVISTVKLIKQSKNKKAALAFVLERGEEGYEYEQLDTIYMNTFGDKP